MTETREPFEPTDEERAVLQHAAKLAAPLFQEHGWTWGGDVGGYIPTGLELYEHLLVMLEDIKSDADPEFALHSCGRFTMVSWPDEETIEVHLDLGAIFGADNQMYAAVLSEDGV